MTYGSIRHMKRTTIFLPEPLERQLQLFARRHDLPVAAVVREAVDQASRSPSTCPSGCRSTFNSGRNRCLRRDSMSCSSRISTFTEDRHPDLMTLMPETIPAAIVDSGVLYALFDAERRLACAVSSSLLQGRHAREASSLSPPLVKSATWSEAKLPSRRVPRRRRLAVAGNACNSKACCRRTFAA